MFFGVFSGLFWGGCRKISAGDHVLYSPAGARPAKGKVVSVAGDKAAVFLPGKGEVSVDIAMLKKVWPLPNQTTISL